MQIVIDISPEAMEDIKNDRASRCFLQNKILNGKPLPAGHGRLIDVDALKPDYDWEEYVNDIGQLMVYGYQAYTTEQIDNAPTIIEADKEEEE